MYKEVELNIGEETQVVKFRLTSENAYMMEEKMKKSILEFLQEESMTMVLTTLRYMRMWEQPQFSIKDAQKLYDNLVDNGWTYKRIIQDIIYETLVVSGFLEEAEWTEMKQQAEEVKKKLKEKLKNEVLKSI